jgi:inner membrane protein
MDNITHTLVGLMLSRAGLNRVTPRATAILLLAANAPDIDAVTWASSSVRYLEYHRGWTHALAAIPVLAALSVLVVRLLGRKPLPWARALLVAVIGAASHPLLDWTNVYGVKLLLPFSDDWLHADLFYIVDIWIWAVLLVALAGPAISRLVSSEIGARKTSGRGAAIFALCALAIYGAGRALLHQRAVAILDARLYQGQVPSRVAAVPTPVNPLRWTGLVEGESFYEVHDQFTLLADFDPAGGEVFYKPEASPALEAARRTEAFRVFLGFSQYPLLRVTPVAEIENGKLVEATDLRFAKPSEEQFVASALLDGGLRVVRSGFAFGGGWRPVAGRR